MNKAASSAERLGTKRVCPKCATKFYDFNREEVVCPKCGKAIDITAAAAPAAFKPAPAAPKKAVRAADEDGDSGTEEIATESEFESIEDLETDEEEVADIEVADEDESEF